MDLVSTKVVVATILGLWRFFCGVLPVKLDRWLRKWEESSADSKTFINEKRHRQVGCCVALIQSFGGGVLFATCLLHMMKQLFLSMEEVQSMWGVYTEYPLSQLFIAFGFFLVYFLEEFTHWAVNNGRRRRCGDAITNKIVRSISRYTDSDVVSGRSSKIPTKVSPVRTVSTIEEWGLNQKNEQLTCDSPLNSPAQNQEVLQRRISSRSNYSIKEELQKANDDAISELQLTPEDEDSLKNKEKLLRCILTIAALSLHSLLEGLSIGIQKDVYEIWYLSIAVSVHSASLVFCMSVELILAQTRVMFIVTQVTVLSLASPAGIAIGILLTASVSSVKPSAAMSVAAIILESLCAGTILYITFFEVLNREKERRVYRIRRGLCIIGGFVLMALLQYPESNSGTYGFFRSRKELQIGHANKTF